MSWPLSGCKGQCILETENKERGGGSDCWNDTYKIGLIFFVSMCQRDGQFGINHVKKRTSLRLYKIHKIVYYMSLDF